MPAYFVIEVDVTDPAEYEAYRHQVPPTLEKYGGRALARGFATPFEGSEITTRMSIIEFEDGDMAKRWYDSDEVRRLNALRQNASRSTARLIDMT